MHSFFFINNALLAYYYTNTSSYELTICFDLTVYVYKKKVKLQAKLFPLDVLVVGQLRQLERLGSFQSSGYVLYI